MAHRLQLHSGISRSPSFFAEERPSATIEPDACPIVLLPGFASPSRVMIPLERKLRRCLRRSVICVHLGYGLGDIAANAERVNALLEERWRERPFQFVDVVAHSMGGLVALYLLKVVNPHYRIRRVITLGTPHHGTPLALAGVLLLGAVSRAVWQMCPHSPLLRRLREASVPEHAQVIAVEADRDGFVPNGYARVVPTNRQCNEGLEGLGHRALLNAQESLSLVSKLLEAA